MPTTPPQKKRAGKKVANGLVALGSAAIVSVYAAGYVRTQSAEAAFDVQALPTRVAPVFESSPALAVATSTAPPRIIAAFPPLLSTAVPTRAGAISPTSAPAIIPTSVPTVAPTAAPTSNASAGAFRDGSYIGMGRSRHGNIEVTVIVQGGKIASAKISQCLTRYPCSMITVLPGEVVARQSADVDTVSGATDSTTAFREGVANALAKGK